MSEKRDRVFLSLGSNLGDREHVLTSALIALEHLKRVDIEAVSRLYETEPWGLAGQPEFLNLAVALQTSLSPQALLAEIQRIERELGREPGVEWGPRVIDIDVILWGSRQISDANLIVPHPEFRNRAFVLAPLAEIAGDAVDPETSLTISELAHRPEAIGRVRALHAIAY